MVHTRMRTISEWFQENYNLILELQIFHNHVK